MDRTIRAIETPYNGALFRSRLEARWAATFDLLGIPYTYEPFDFDGYVPDFFLEGKHPVLVEVRPAVTPADYREMAREMDARAGEFWDHDMLALGASPLVSGLHYPKENVGPDDSVMGYLCEVSFFETANSDRLHEMRSWDWAVWRKCGAEPHIRFNHCLQSYHGRPCGHYEGGSWTTVPDISLRELWNRAHWLTRWVPAR